jgi:hypothetical protein
MGPMVDLMAKGAAVHPGIDRLLERIRERVTDYFPDIGNGPTSVRVTGWSRRAYSDIYRVSVGSQIAGTRELIVKVFDQAEAQFRALTSVWPHFAAHPTWKIPRALDYFDEPAALLLEPASGRPLEAGLPWVAWWGTSLLNVETDLRRAGQWLRFYHELGGPQEAKTLDTEGRWKSFEQARSQLTDAGFSRRSCARLADRLRPLAEEAALLPLRVSHVHGDFKLDNVLVDGPRVTVLDIWGARWNAVEHDIASFLNSLLLQRLTRPAPVSALRRLAAAFLRGYFGHGPYPAAAILFLQGTGLADVCLEILGRRRSVAAQAWVMRRLAGATDALAGTFGEVS